MENCNTFLEQVSQMADLITIKIWVLYYILNLCERSRETHSRTGRDWTNFFVTRAKLLVGGRWRFAVITKLSLIEKKKQKNNWQLQKFTEKCIKSQTAREKNSRASTQFIRRKKEENKHTTAISYVTVFRYSSARAQRPRMIDVSITPGEFFNRRGALT